mmetsp:Transcript_53358/g.141418  ORF Transcript_53358/g.141418 Transcript_53358/m.141418 type:complete len:211 (-) Transcript_53358:268-900(-)
MRNAGEENLALGAELEAVLAAAVGGDAALGVDHRKGRVGRDLGLERALAQAREADGLRERLAGADDAGVGGGHDFERVGVVAGGDVAALVSKFLLCKDLHVGVAQVGKIARGVRGVGLGHMNVNVLENRVHARKSAREGNAFLVRDRDEFTVAAGEAVASGSGRGEASLRASNNLFHCAASNLCSTSIKSNSARFREVSLADVQPKLLEE